MKILVTKIFLITLCISCWASLTVASEVSVPPSVLLLERINELRENPKQVIASHGLNAEQLLTRMPEIAEDLNTGMAALDIHPQLTAAADNHLSEMLTYGYYDKKSLDGRLPWDRITEQGYLPELSGETLAMLGFGNFMSPANAVDIIFANMLGDELNKSDFSQLTILHPQMEQIGIGFGAGTVQNGLHILNMYLAVCDLARHILSSAELEVLSQINTARITPEVYSEMVGVDVDGYENPEKIIDLLSRQLPMVDASEVLTEVTDAIGTDIMNNEDYASAPLATDTVIDRILEKGYLVAKVGKAVRMMITIDPVDPLQGVKTHIARIFSRELNYDDGARTILNPDYTHVGISVLAGESGEWSSDGSAQSPYYNLLLVVVFSQGLEEIIQF